MRKYKNRTGRTCAKYNEKLFTNAESSVNSGKLSI